MDNSERVWEQPKVSVIIPVYNTEQYLEQCLESIVNQTLTDIEILCIDDGSTDHSLDILKRYEERDSRIRVLTQKNAGAGAARNYGLREARGSYLSFLDADDFFELTMLEKAYKKAVKDEADYVVFNSDQYDTEKKEFAQVPWVMRICDIPPYTPFTYRQLTDNVFKSFMGWAWDKLYLHSFVKEKNLWFQEQRTSNDLLFVFSALITARRISVLDEVLAHQRRGNRESLSNTREKSWFCFYEALLELRKRLKEEKVYEELERDFINYALHFSLWHLNTLAYPTHELLYEKLRNEWFEELGVKGKAEEYFYNRGEYREYLKLVG